MDMEIQFLHDNFTEKDSKLLMDHIQRMAFGEAPFFAATLSLVYDKLVEKAFTQPAPSGSGLRKSAKVESVADPRSPLQPPVSVPGAPPTPTLSNVLSTPSSVPQTPAPGPVPRSTAPRFTWLRCHRCLGAVGLRDLHDGLRCPRCPPGDVVGAPLMQCTLCRIIRTERRDTCICGARFV